MTRRITPAFIYDQLGLQDAAVIIDVRRGSEIHAVPKMIPGSLQLDPADAHAWSRKLPPQRSIVLYGQTGADDLNPVAGALSTLGQSVCVLDGGLDGWIAQARPTVRVRNELGVPGRSQWVTRERPKIDRLACPWLVRRFIDPLASFLYVPAHDVRACAASLGAQPYDIVDVTFSHRGANCSFDAFLDEFDLHDPVLDRLAEIVRAADTDTLTESKEAAGLLAISLGLAATTPDDNVLLERAMSLYDALYAWCKTARHETHSWPQARSA